MTFFFSSNELALGICVKINFRHCLLGPGSPNSVFKVIPNNNLQLFSTDKITYAIYMFHVPSKTKVDLGYKHSMQVVKVI